MRDSINAALCEIVLLFSDTICPSKTMRADVYDVIVLTAEGFEGFFISFGGCV